MRLQRSSFHQNRTKTWKVWDPQILAFFLFFSHFFEDFEGLNGQRISTQCTHMNFYNPPKATIYKFNPYFILFEKSCSSNVVMLPCYSCFKTSKYQSSKKVKRNIFNLSQNRLLQKSSEIWTSKKMNFLITECALFGFLTATKLSPNTLTKEVKPILMEEQQLDYRERSKLMLFGLFGLSGFLQKDQN